MDASRLPSKRFVAKRDMVGANRPMTGAKPDGAISARERNFLKIAIIVANIWKLTLH
jgi:hypothetical protein